LEGKALLIKRFPWSQVWIAPSTSNRSRQRVEMESLGLDSGVNRLDMLIMDLRAIICPEVSEWFHSYQYSICLYNFKQYECIVLIY
jgi:hypothetical protein